MESLFDGANNRFYPILMVIFFRYVILAGIAFVIFYLLRRNAWSFKKIQRKFPVISDYQREFLYSVSTAFIFAGLGYLFFLGPLARYTLVYKNFSDHSLLYFFFSVTVILVVHDTYFYWAHRLMHHPKLFKYFHKVHHLSTNPSPWAAMAFHPLEAVVEFGIIVVISFLFPVHLVAIALFLLIMMIYNVYGHLGYELYPKGFSKSMIGKWINTSINHNQHHEHFVGNYGLYFLWWDRWMGTLREDYDNKFEEVKSRNS
ncbi:MAG: sterol desaturase family protein [Cyclobacteriaceae bacterium]|nr:sterol desaturase family protein [Cyclobacteriaceae bacterium]